MAIERIDGGDLNFEEFVVERVLPNTLLDLISDYSDSVQFTSVQQRNEVKIPRSISVRVRRLKSEARSSDDSSKLLEAEMLAERHRLRKHGVTERQLIARGRLNEQVELLADNSDISKEKQVLAGMRVAWYAFAAGIIDPEKRNNIINELDEINPLVMQAIEEHDVWRKIYNEEIKQVVPLV